MSYFSPEYNKDVHNVVLKRCLRAKLIIRALKLTKRASKRAHFPFVVFESSKKRLLPAFLVQGLLGTEKATKDVTTAGRGV